MIVCGIHKNFKNSVIQVGEEVILSTFPLEIELPGSHGFHMGAYAIDIWNKF